jgi:PIF1-like helicase
LAFRNVILHLALFIPWEKFLNLDCHNLVSTWHKLLSTLKPRLQFYAKNISLLRKSVDDAKADIKLWNQAQEDTEILSGFQETYNSGELQDENNSTAAIDSTTLYVFRDYLLSLIEDQANPYTIQRISSLSQLLDSGQDECIEISENEDKFRDGRFYNILQADSLYSSGIATYTKVQIGTIAKSQKRSDQRILDKISGRQDIDQGADLATAIKHFGPNSSFELRIDSQMSLLDIAIAMSKAWTLNKLQSLALIQPFEFLENISETNHRQFFMYLGGAGGTGKSRVLDAIRDVFKAKNSEHQILITASSGSAAAKIQGITIHSALSISRNDTGSSTKQKLNQSGRDETSQPQFISEKRLQDTEMWSRRLILVIDEISMISGVLLYDIDQKCRKLGNQNMPFGGIRVVLFTGDFYQFPPVNGISLLKVVKVIEDWNPEQRFLDIERTSTAWKHMAGYKLFQQFTNVIILKTQVRASSCSILRGVLSRLRSGHQTVLDYHLLKAKRVSEKNIDLTNGLRTLTCTNRTKTIFNVEATIQWAEKNNTHISIFISKHEWLRDGQKLQPTEALIEQALSIHDSSKVKVPPYFIYTPGIPVMTTENEHIGLKLVNGAEFKAIGVIPDVLYPGVAVTKQVTIHFGPPAAILVMSKDIKDIKIDGLPPSVLLLTPKTTSLPEIPQSIVCKRTGVKCTAAFAMTDYKAQGKSFPLTLLDLTSAKGKLHTTSTESAKTVPFETLYVQLSRATSWNGIHIQQLLSEESFLKCKIGDEIERGLSRLERLADQSVERFQRRCTNHTSENLKQWLHLWEQLID